MLNKILGVSGKGGERKKHRLTATGCSQPMFIKKSNQRDFLFLEFYSLNRFPAVISR